MKQTLALILILFFCTGIDCQGTIENYVFFNLDRHRIQEESFLETGQFIGAQLKYTWKELEPVKDNYDFLAIYNDLTYLSKHGKKLFIQLQDVTFDTSRINVPQYLVLENKYGGGVNIQYLTDENDRILSPDGYVARRWDENVAERFHRLVTALAKEFDGKIEGINFPETAVGFGESGKLYPQGFTPEIYRDAILKQMDHSYKFLKKFSRDIKTGIAVQWGNYEEINPKTGKQVTVDEIYTFGNDEIGLDYIFWCTQEPYYTDHLIPFLKGQE